MFNSAEHETLNPEIAKINGNFRVNSQKPAIYSANKCKHCWHGILTFTSRMNIMLS